MFVFINYITMKKILVIIVVFLTGFCTAQTSEFIGGEYIFPVSDQDCLSNFERQQIHTEINTNRQILEQQGILKTAAQRAQMPLVHPQFIWPVTKNPSAPYSNIWSISNHVDHNLSYPNQVQDYNCGNRTYDTSGGYNHSGIDIYTWPFSWYSFQNNYGWVIAAANGVIIAKSNGNFDMNCSMGSGNWNAVYIQHSDGSVAWYGHLKSGSLTSKPIGSTVIAGEFLGVIGSSGSSTGPHLHFEVYNSPNQLVDTYSGPCNNWTSSTDSWWLSQKPYQDPKINAVLTHSAPPVFNTCPQTETTNLSNTFDSGSMVYAAFYLADQLSGTSGTLQLKRPNASIAVSIPINFNTSYSSSYWYLPFNSDMFNQSGTWTLSLTYLGNTVNHTFSYGALGIQDFADAFAVFPNPANDILNIQSKKSLVIDKVQLYDMTGKQVYHNNGETTVDIRALSGGIYMLNITSGDVVYKSKVVKN